MRRFSSWEYELVRKLLLLSLGIEAVRGFVGSDPKTLTMGFIPTAGDTYENPTFVQRDRKILAEMGFRILDVDLKNKTENQLRDDLIDVDVICVAGGNTFYLLQKTLESGFDRLLTEMLDRGVFYIGFSAGAVLVGPDLEPIQSIDDPTGAPNLKSTKALGLVPFVVLPHYDDGEAALYQKIKEQYGDRFELITISDRQAVLVRGDSYEVVSSE